MDCQFIRFVLRYDGLNASRRGLREGDARSDSEAVGAATKHATTTVTLPGLMHYAWLL